MKFFSTYEVAKRLTRQEPLTREEIEEAVSHVQFFQPDALHRYFAELLSMLARELVSVRAAMDENRAAIKSFDEASGRLSKRIYWLTWVLVFVGVIQLAVTFILVWRN